jgi:hypothetical protein
MNWYGALYGVHELKIKFVFYLAFSAIFENGLRRFRIIFRQKNIDVNRPAASLADLNQNLKFTQTLNHNIFLISIF